MTGVGWRMNEVTVLPPGVSKGAAVMPAVGATEASMRPSGMVSWSIGTPWQSCSAAAPATLPSSLLFFQTSTYCQPAATFWRFAWSPSWPLSGIGSIYTTTGGRARTNTLYLSATRFFQLAGLGTASTLQLSDVGNLDIGTLTGTWKGMRVIGSYGFSNANTAIVGDSGAFLVGETPNAPVEMRAVEPTIGGMEVGVIGAFKSTVFDTQRFIRV